MPSIGWHYIHYILHFVHRLIIFSWGSWSSFSAYKRFKGRDIRPWIIMRYKLLSITFFIMVIQAFLLIFMPYGSYYGDPSPIESFIIYAVSVILVLIYGITTMLVWVMPDWLKKYLDRNFEVQEEKEYTNENLIAEIKKELGQE